MKQYVYLVNGYRLGSRFGCCVNLGDCRREELARSAQARDALWVKVEILQEKVAFSALGEFAHLFPLLLQRFE